MTDSTLGARRVGFGEAIALGFRKYAVFRGRASRSEYWFWVLFGFLVNIGATLLDLALFNVANGLFSIVAGLALFLPGLAISVRRLHDIDWSGWFILIALIPLVGAIILIVMFCGRGTAGPNRFGPEFA